MTVAVEDAPRLEGSESEPARRTGWEVYQWVTPARVCATLAVVGVALRLRQYLFNRSIWSDEAELAVTIMNHGFAALSHPTTTDTAPLGFAWLLKLVTLAFGTSERSFRLVPFLAAAVGMVAFSVLALRTIRGWGACVAVAIFALSPTLVYYAGEIKPYSIDATALVVIVLGADYLRTRPLTWPRVLAWGVGLTLLCWCSYPGVWIGAAATLALLVVVLTRRDLPGAARLCVGCFPWAVSLFVEYLVSLRPLHGVMAANWAEGFAPRPLHFGSTVTWLWSTARSDVAYPLNLDFGSVAVIVVVLGLVLLCLRHHFVGAVCATVVAATAVLGVAGLYPIAPTPQGGGRLLLYLVPVGALALGSLVTRAWTGLLGTGLVAVVCLSVVSQGVAAAGHPYTKAEGREALRYALAHAGPRDAVFVDGTGTWVYTYYHESTGLQAKAEIWLYSTTKPCSPSAQTAWMDRYHQVWVVFPGPTGPDGLTGPHPVSTFGSALRALGPVTKVVDFPGALDMRVTVHPTPEGPRPTTGGDYGCVGIYILPR